MRRQGLNAPYLPTRTNLIRMHKLSATTEPLLLHRCCYSQLFLKQMDTLNFKFNLNRVQVDKHLKTVGYSKIGHKKTNAVGYCIMINRKQFFEIESIENPNISQSSNISDLKQYCL